MTAPSRIRVLTPEQLDAKAAALVNTSGTALATAVAAKAGTSTGTATGVTTATANTLMGRDANARAQIAAPSAGLDIANKAYVDSTVGGYVQSNQLGAASGVATLDSSSFLSSAQVPQYLGRSLGSGTSFPSSPRAGDVCVRTDIGSNGTMFEYTGVSALGVSGWITRGPIVCTSALSPAALYNGVEKYETDTNYRYYSDGTNWIKLSGWGAPNLFFTYSANPTTIDVGTGASDVAAVAMGTIPATAAHRRGRIRIDAYVEVVIDSNINTAGYVQLGWSNLSSGAPQGRIGPMTRFHNYAAGVLLPIPLSGEILSDGAAKSFNVQGWNDVGSGSGWKANAIAIQVTQL